jgi:hypothetical protein
METKEMKIQVPEGYEIDRENSTFENIIFRKAERKLPKKWEDLENVNGYYVDSWGDVRCYYGVNTPDHTNKNIFPTKEEAEACLALAQLCQLRDRYNEGWKPHWEDYNETKYCIEFCQGRIETIDRVNCHKILTFKTEDLRDKFLENFKDLIETAKPLL